MALVKEWKSLLSVAQWRNEWFKREPKNKNRQKRTHKPAEGSEGLPVDKYKLVEQFQKRHFIATKNNGTWTSPLFVFRNMYIFLQ